eukprot:782717-Prymnesium_polylepis.1
MASAPAASRQLSSPPPALIRTPSSRDRVGAAAPRPARGHAGGLVVCRRRALLLRDRQAPLPVGGRRR